MRRNHCRQAQQASNPACHPERIDGTLNHFARDLGIPFDVSGAIDIICAGHSIGIDVGAVNDIYFLNNSSVGLYPAIVKLRESLPDHL